jgi:hypothetical protein
VSGVRFSFRAAAMLAGGSLAVHQLRYSVGYGGHSGGALHEQGHAYLLVLLPLMAIACALVVAAWMRASLHGRGYHTPGLGRTWIGASLALAACYAGQELIEGALATGHPAGLGGILGHGGWSALVISPAVGLLVALALRPPRAPASIAAARPHATAVSATPPPARPNARSGSIFTVPAVPARAPPYPSAV